ncbi:MAG TPA: DUF2953 domain-containing protein [Clostridia bacterium]|nr:DUF2953 domain-containing protein [Clostridia bacterium]
MKVLGCIFLLIVLVLMVPVVVHVDSHPELTVTVKYLWFKKGILPKGEGRAKKKTSDSETGEKTKKIKEKRELSATLQELLTLVQKLLRRTSPAVRRLLRRTSLAKLRMRMIVAGKDAADTAIKFGKVNAQVFTAVAIVDRIVTLKADQIQILPGFGVSQSESSYSGEMRLSPFALLVAGVQIAFWGLVAGLPLVLKSRKNKTLKKAGGDADAARKEDQNGKETSFERGA